MPHRIGQRIKQSRERRGLTQGELGRRLGVSFQMVQAYEHGSKLTLDRIATIADVLSERVEWLLMGTEIRLIEAASRYVRAIPPARLGFYGRPADIRAVVDTDAQCKAACGLPADAPNHLAWERWFKRIHSDDHARIAAELARLETEGEFDAQYRLIGVDGVERTIIDYGRTISGRLQGMMLDITHEPRSDNAENRIRIVIAAGLRSWR